MVAILFLYGALGALVNCWPDQGETNLVPMSSDKFKMDTALKITVGMETTIYHEMCIFISCGGWYWDRFPRVLQLYFGKNNITASNFKPDEPDSERKILFETTDREADYTAWKDITVHIIMSEKLFTIFLGNKYLGNYEWDSTDPAWGSPEKFHYGVTGRPQSASGEVMPYFPRFDIVPIDANTGKWDDSHVIMITGWPNENNMRLSFDFLPPMGVDVGAENKTLMTFVQDWNTDQVVVNNQNNDLEWMTEEFIKPVYLKKDHFFEIYFYNRPEGIEVLVMPEPGTKILYRLIHRKDSEEVYGRFRWGSTFVGKYQLIPAGQVKRLFEKARTSGDVFEMPTGGAKKSDDIEELEKSGDEFKKMINEHNILY